VNRTVDMARKITKSEPETPIADRPPLVEDELNAVIAEFTKHSPLPNCIPKPLESIAAWWMNIVEPPKGDERPYRISAGRWICPYHNRVRYLLRKFLHLSEPDRRLILAAREENIFWRGEDRAFFETTITYYGKMRAVGVEAYRDACLKKTNGFLRKTTGD